MEIFLTTISLTLLGGLLLSPIFLLRYLNRTNIKNKFFTYLTLGIVMTTVIAFAFAWWAYTSDLILLKHYGYEIDGMNETEFYGKVLPENMEKVKGLETSVMGIGWPLQAIMAFMFYSPYLLIVYGATYLIGRKPKKHSTSMTTDKFANNFNL